MPLFCISSIAYLRYANTEEWKFILAFVKGSKYSTSKVINEADRDLNVAGTIYTTYRGMPKVKISGRKDTDEFKGKSKWGEYKRAPERNLWCHCWK